ncbi:MAG: ABC transporter ATP-binding protein [Acidimicrobiales bacterium]
MIEVKKLQQVYGKSVALDIDHLVIDRGTTALVGHNGAGKSTLLLITAGLLRPTSGTVDIDGCRAGSIAARELVSFVPDQPALFDDLTLWDQMVYVARLHGRTEPDAGSMHLIETLDAFELLERFPRAMSKGQRQKASLLVATARPLTVLLADEPTTGLDAAAKTAFVEALSSLVDQGISVVSSTHDDELIERSTASIRLAGGRVIESEGAPPTVDADADTSDDAAARAATLKPGERADRWARRSSSDPTD